MVRFIDDFSLKSYTTFGIACKAKHFFEFTDSPDLGGFLKSDKFCREKKHFVLGGGSNLLFLEDYDGLIIHPNVPGIEIIREDRQHVWVEAGAGEDWDEFVHYCVAQGFGGLENLSLIPGRVGAAPIQNIGAYGREVCRFVETVKGYDMKTMEEHHIPAGDCRFAYRNSIFKNELKGRFIVLSVIFRLDKFPEFELGYGGVEDEVRKLGGVNLQNIRQAIINIRTGKLPDTKKVGSAGSFFKNPVVGKDVASGLKERYPDLPTYPAGEGRSKLAAGWLVDRCGWKGYRNGGAGVHGEQALVLVNYGNATGKQIFELSEKIRQSVFDKFGVPLEREVDVVF
ncbi:UDP-N-acetylenolpyruvoylglucosamine reductase [hydrothermal vent metagenome]|uniref:UDP-N-acetylmuramate dehydrogenase n=1 Tax=hydrothermal vent metagenome TaxID=652676 RepID=A0A3B0T881_9ZZZZ